MKIQTLALIFILIILPISFALSLYLNMQMNTINLQGVYDARLQKATHDTLQAFQINTANNTESALANSKLNDIESSIELFFNSLSTSFALKGNDDSYLKEYVPALVYTMYDGYYIYSPYSNVATTTSDGVTINELEEKNIEYGLKPYIYYSCRYRINENNDFIITYSLDNYIDIKGIIHGNYVNDAGYLVSNIEKSGNSYRYNGITIEAETQLEEYVGNTVYPYVKINGTKYYLDNANKRIFYILNGNIYDQVTLNNNATLYNKYVNLITNNTSAIRYYKEAYEFTNRVLNDYGLKDLTISKACDANGNAIKFTNNTYQYVFRQDEVADKTPLEYSTSNFNQHRKQVIRYTIESNLSMAIANFNKYTKNTSYDYQMPQLKETDWDLLAGNISIISFLQGLDIGSKIYNGYDVIANNETKELIREEDIYIVGKDNNYHRVEDKYLLQASSLGDSTNKSTQTKGILDLDVTIKNMNTTNNNKISYYARKELACYNCIVNQSGINNDFKYTSIYEYLSKIPTTEQSNLLRKIYYTALGRERWGGISRNIKVETLEAI